jgi:hypothetical protein
MPYTIDGDWTQINDKQDLSGNPLAPVMARLVRTMGGMVVGRIIRDETRFRTELYKFGDWKVVGIFTSFDDAHRALLNA